MTETVENMTDVEFLDELPQDKRAGKWDVFANILRDNPNRWARLPRTFTGLNKSIPSQVAGSIKYGNLVSFRPKGTFEAKAINGLVYVRFVGLPE